MYPGNKIAEVIWRVARYGRCLSLDHIYYSERSAVPVFAELR